MRAYWIYYGGETSRPYLKMATFYNLFVECKGFDKCSTEVFKFCLPWNFSICSSRVNWDLADCADAFPQRLGRQSFFLSLRWLASFLSLAFEDSATITVSAMYLARWTRRSSGRWCLRCRDYRLLWRGMNLVVFPLLGRIKAFAHCHSLVCPLDKSWVNSTSSHGLSHVKWQISDMCMAVY